MRKIKDILYSEQEVDVMLIQPHFLMRLLQADQNEIVKDYWDSMNNNEPLGDLPNEPNHGLFSLAASVKKAGYTVDLLDFHTLDRVLREHDNRMIEQKDIEDSIKKKKAKIFGISSITVASRNALLISSIIKKYHPDAIVMLGGMHPTLFGKELIANPNVDIIIRGEGNKTLIELIESEGKINKLKEIKGISFKDKSGNIIDTHKKSCNHIDADDLPYPDYDLICEESLPLMPRVFSVKGCPFSCAFCSCNAFYNTSYDDYNVCYRDPKKVVDEIEYLYNKYHMEFYCFGDLTFMCNKEIGHKICNELIKRNLGNVKWWCQTTVGQLNEEDLKLMKQAGCVQVGMGVENSSQDALDTMGKPIHFDKTEEQCKLIRKAGISPITYWIIGLAEESFESANKLINKICYFIENELTDLSHIGVPVPYPGSPLFEDPKSFGLEIMHTDFSRYWMNSDELGYSKPAVRTMHLSQDHIYSLWKYALMSASEKYKKRYK